MKLIPYIFISFLNSFYLENAHGSPQAILVNGGGTVSSNYCDFFEDIDRSNRILKGWQKTNLVADGDIPNGPPNSNNCDPVAIMNNGPELVRKQTQAPINASATKEILKSQMQNLKGLKNDEPVMLYFTDHGGRDLVKDKAKFSLSLWNEDLTKEELQDMIRDFKKQHPNNPIILIHDHCFSGGMMDNFVSPDSDDIIPGVCGFATASPNEYSFTGQSFMKNAETYINYGNNDDKKITFSNIFNEMKYSDLVDSTPTSSSDIFLERASQKRAKKIAEEGFAVQVCQPEKEKTAVLNLENTSKKLDKYNNTGELKFHIFDLCKTLDMPYNTSLKDLEKKLDTKKEEILKIENDIVSAETMMSDVRVEWAEKEFKTNFGEEPYNWMDLDGDMEEKIKVKDGSFKTRNELLDWTSKTTRIDKNNPEFKTFVKNESQKGKWKEDVMEQPEKLKEQFTQKNKDVSPLIRLVQTKRKLEIVQTLTPTELEKYNNLLKCENTPVDLSGEIK